MEALGFIGLGAMGAPMVGRLLAAGHRVLAHDVNAVALAAAVSRGAEGRDSPAAVASEAEVVLVSLPTPDVVRQVALGAGGLAEGSALRIYIDLSTSRPPGRRWRRPWQRGWPRTASSRWTLRSAAASPGRKPARWR